MKPLGRKTYEYRETDRNCLSLYMLSLGFPWKSCLLTWQEHRREEVILEAEELLEERRCQQRRAKASAAGRRQAAHAAKIGRQAMLRTVCDGLPRGLTRREWYAKIREEMLAQGFRYGKQSSSLTRDLHAVGRSWVLPT